MFMVILYDIKFFCRLKNCGCVTKLGEPSRFRHFYVLNSAKNKIFQMSISEFGTLRFETIFRFFT